MPNDVLFEKTPVSEHRISVLLVDDQAMIGEAVRRMLAGEADIQFHYCDDPTAALARAADVSPTIVLLDLVMPDLDGLTLLKFFRANEGTRDVPIIVLSSKEEAVTKAEAFELGASDYLVKLPDPIELIARVRHHSRGYIALLERNEAFAALERSQQTLARELAKAAAYVRSLLPEPMHGDVASAWRFIPSVQLGGDAFGYHWLDGDRLALYLLDVSGHGVKSALLSMTAMSTLRMRTLPDVDFGRPSAVLGGLNGAFQMDLFEGMYFTIWYGVFDRRSRRLVHASAGHPPALLVSHGAGGVSVQKVGESGFTIGMLPGVAFEDAEVTVPRASNLFLVSDGAYEITRPDGDMWSIDDLADFVGSHDPAGGLADLDAVESALRTVRGEPDFEDDVSVLELHFS